MVVSKKQFAVYLGVSYNTALKYYQLYLDILEKKSPFLTDFDISKIDLISVEQVKANI